MHRTIRGYKKLKYFELAKLLQKSIVLKFNFLDFYRI